MNQPTSLTFVLFGATGDLAQKKIMPALLALYKAKKLPENFTIIAFSRRTWNEYDYRKFIAPSLKNPEEFLEKIIYFQGSFDLPLTYTILADKLKDLDQEKKTISQNFFYLSIQPEFYETVSQGLSGVGLLADGQKVLIEKPFGKDLASAGHLEKNLEASLNEHTQLFRIDHYLGKAGLWNMLETRKNDLELESKLTAKNVNSISVRFLEQIGIEGRGEFYNSVGALRDVVQNHCLEMLGTALMDIPQNKNPQTIRAARAQVLKNLKQIDLKKISEFVIRAQYEGYLKEPDVPADSKTETYIKIQTEVQSDRWHGVPIIIEAGKALKEKRSEVEFLFNDGSTKFFNIDIPKEPEAYETIIEAALQNEMQYFVSNDEVLASWQFVTPIIENLKTLELKKYKQGTLPV